MRFALPLAAPSVAVLGLVLAAGGVAQAQMPSMGSLGGMGAMGGKGAAGGLMGGLAPDVSSVGAGNAAGVIGYCVKNKVLGEGSAAGALMGKLKGQAGAGDPGYAAGQSGQLQMGGSTLSMDSLKGQMKTKVCDMVLSHAKAMT